MTKNYYNILILVDVLTTPPPQKKLLHFFLRLKQSQYTDGVNTHFVLPARKTVHKSLSKMPTLQLFTTKAHPLSESRTLLPRSLKSRALMLTQKASQQTQEAGALWCDSSRGGATANTGHFLCIGAHTQAQRIDHVRSLMQSDNQCGSIYEYVWQLKADWRTGISDQSPAQSVAAETINQTVLVIKHHRFAKNLTIKGLNIFGCIVGNRVRIPVVFKAGATATGSLEMDIYYF